jgi:outer membrane protein assembly factor BamB
MRFSILLLGAALLLSGCGGLDTVKNLSSGLENLFTFSSDNAEPPAELKDLEPGVRLKTLWEAGVGDGYAGQWVGLVPAVTEDKVFAADRHGEVQARNRLTGDKLWSADTELAISAGPVAAGNKVLVGTSDAEVVALSAEDGSVLWKATLSSEILALPRVEGDTVVVRSSDGRIAALDEDTGATRWTQDRTVPALSVRSLGSPTVAGDLVLDGYGGGRLIALALKDGAAAWEATVAIPHGRSEIERLVDMDANPLVDGDTVYVSGYQAGVAAVNLKDGDVLWRRENLYSHVGLAAGRRSLYLTDGNSDVWELDMRNGADLWKQSDLHLRRLTAPALVGSHLVVGDFEGYLHVLSKDDGGLVGRLKLDDEPIRAAPVVFDDVIYVYTAGGTLAALAVE